MLIPLLLERGDPMGREFALRLAEVVGTPTIHATLRDFALSRNGTDDQRFDALGIATSAGLASNGMVRMWVNGAWEETLHLGFEITDGSTRNIPSRIRELMGDAITAQRDGNFDEAERLLLQALAIDPDALDIQNNLAAIYEASGRKTEAMEITQRIHALHPEYLFAALTVARLKALDGEIEEAKALAHPFMLQKQLHVSELRTLCDTELLIAQLEGTLDKAGAWLEIWESVEPEHPMLARWQQVMMLSEMQTRFPKLIREREKS